MTVEKLKKQIDSGIICMFSLLYQVNEEYEIDTPEPLAEQDPYAVGTLFLQYFGQLPEKLFTSTLSYKFIWAQGIREVIPREMCDYIHRNGRSRSPLFHDSLFAFSVAASS